MAADAPNSAWLGLVIGNSRLHWAAFEDRRWLGTWHTPHLTAVEVDRLAAARFDPQSWRGIIHSASIPLARPTSLWVAPAVAAQADLWRGYDGVFWVKRDRLPLTHLYPTLGLDRALALLGAGITYGWPVLVIDGGTALTLTAGECPSPSDLGQFTGGAILPGLSLQIRALTTQTDALPEIALPNRLPPRWATTTVEAIQSGILYTLLAGVAAYLADWQQRYPQGKVFLTGGDGDRLMSYLTALYGIKNNPDAVDIGVDEHLIFWGLRAYRDCMLGRP